MTGRFEQFTASVGRVYKCIQRIKSREMDEFGLRGAHVMCLYFLGRSPEGLTSGELAAACGEDKAAISRAVRELGEKELVRVDETVKRYRAKVRLTQAGQEMVRRMEQVITQVVAQADRGLTDGERETFYRVFDVISNNLQAYMDSEGL